MTTAIALLTTGCAEPKAPAAPAVEKTAPEATTPNPTGAPESPNPAEEKTSVDNQSGDSPAAAYAPPFPERIDLFTIPQRVGRGKNSSGEYGEAVELIGFANLDRPQALLLFNGQITTLAEGESIYGVEVVSIQRPKVVLQRGRQRWQTSLEN